MTLSVLESDLYTFMVSSIFFTSLGGYYNSNSPILTDFPVLMMGHMMHPAWESSHGGQDSDDSDLSNESMHLLSLGPLAFLGVLTHC